MEMEFELTLGQIAEMTGGRVVGDPSLKIVTILPPEQGAGNALSPLWEKKFIDTATKEAVLLTKPGWIKESSAGVEVEDPRVALVTLLEYYERLTNKESSGIHASAQISPNAKIGQNVSVGPCCAVGAAILADGVVLEANVYVGDGVTVGSGTKLEPGVVLYHDIFIGKGCIIHANAVIGCDGFGFVPDAKLGLRRIPQIGTVIIGDNVEVGVCASIDRATFGATRIGRGTKIDSHVKIGHNCRIGDFCVIVSQSGVAGSSVVGNGVTLAAQSGVANHAKIGDGTIVAGRGGVSSDIGPGETVSGFPARDHKLELHERAAVRKLPDLLKDFRDLKKKVERLEEKSEQ